MQTLIMQEEPEKQKRSVSQWGKRYSHMILYIVVVNLAILLIGYFLQSTGDAEALARKLDVAKEGFFIFGLLRCAFELFVFFNWRTFVGWCRRVFNLGYRKTWFVYQCRTLWKMFMVFDIGTFVLVNLS